eukprot:scaffold166035_cov17-Prasinocladus_malaysianus.AAC.1
MQVLDSRVKVPLYDPDQVQRSAAEAALGRTNEGDSMPLLTEHDTEFEDVVLSRGRVSNFQVAAKRPHYTLLE